ncbi:hypothetical protein GVD08_002706 [Salmonella enterica subsp. enterica]|nr:hypothetical protein [Salmonella enterica subsp. enterica]
MICKPHIGNLQCLCCFCDDSGCYNFLPCGGVHFTFPVLAEFICFFNCRYFRFCLHVSMNINIQTARNITNAASDITAIDSGTVNE